MHLSLIGMSGVGKTFWSTQLEEAGYKRFGCDNLISARLKAVLQRPDGTQMRMGEWMGFPYEPQYEACEKQYLALETQIVREILDYAADAPDTERIVIDTTGSVIYCGDSILDALRTFTTVVHLETPRAVRDPLAKGYMAKPLAVVWNGAFNQQPGESQDEALARSYTEMIAAREKAYKELADMTIPYAVQRGAGFGLESFLELIADGPKV